MNLTGKIFACAFAALLTTPAWGLLVRHTTYSLSTTRTVRALALLLPTTTGVIGWRFVDDPALAAWWWAALHTVPVAMVDVYEHRLPHWWLVSFAGGGLCLFATVATLDHEPKRLAHAMFAGLGMWVAMRILEWSCSGRMGGGDTRLHAILALYTGWMSWRTVLIGFVAGSVLLGITAGLACLWQRRFWSSRIAAGPSLLAGAWLALVCTGH